MTGGVVRCDVLGLRTRVTDWLYETYGVPWDFAARHADDLISRVLDAVPDVPPTEGIAVYHGGQDMEEHARSYNEGYADAQRHLREEVAEILPEHMTCVGVDDARLTVGGEKPSAHLAGALLTRLPVPDVPPDPPAADRDELARGIDPGAFKGHTPNRAYIARERADALLSSGVLVDPADVKARALEDAAAQVHAHTERAWDEGHRQGVLDATSAPRTGITYRITDNPYTDRAVSEREGTT